MDDARIAPPSSNTDLSPQLRLRLLRSPRVRDDALPPVNTKLTSAEPTQPLSSSSVSCPADNGATPANQSAVANISPDRNHRPISELPSSIRKHTARGTANSHEPPHNSTTNNHEKPVRIGAFSMGHQEELNTQIALGWMAYSVSRARIGSLHAKKFVGYRTVRISFRGRRHHEPSH